MKRIRLLDGDGRNCLPAWELSAFSWLPLEAFPRLLVYEEDGEVHVRDITDYSGVCTPCTHGIPAVDCPACSVRSLQKQLSLF